MKNQLEESFDTVSSSEIRQRKTTSIELVLEKRIDDAHFMCLESIPISKEAIELGAKLTSLIWCESGGKNKPGKRLEACVGAIVADLMDAAVRGRDGWGYRSYSAGSFTHAPVGYTTFDRSIKAAKSLGYLEHVKGSRRDIGTGSWAGHSSRFRATDTLLKMAADAGVTPADGASHFGEDKAAVAKRPILILKSDKKKRYREKTGGAPVPVDLTHPLAAIHAKQMEEINTSIRDHTIELPAQAGFPRMNRFKGFHRVFSCGGKSSYGYNQGGRAYPVGGSYQGLEREWRPYLLIDGETSAEVDLGSSQVRIMFALLGAPIGPDDDPYDLPGNPRDVAKLWFMQTVGHYRFHRGWTSDNRKEYTKTINPRHDLSKKYPIRVVEERARSRWPQLEYWEGSGIMWGTLQYEEAQIIIGAIYTLSVEHGVPAFPVHDSIIVPTSQQELAMKALGDSFYARFEVLPLMKVK